jgi:mannosyltransferase
VPLLFAFGRRLWDVPTARLAALLLALSPFHLWYSQEARGYTFLILFAVAASLVFLDMVRRGPGPRRALLYAFLTALAVWSNMSALFLWGAQLLTLLFLERPRERRAVLCWLLAMGGGLVAAAPYLLKAAGILAVGRLVPGSAMGQALRGETTFTPLAYPFTAFSFFFGYSLGPSLQELHQPDRMAALRASLPVMLPAALVATVALGAGLLHLRRRQALLIIWIVVPVLAVTLLALRNVKPFNPRYLAVIFPWMLLLAAGGLLALPRRWSMALSAALLGLFLVAVAGDLFNPRYAKADMRGAAALVAGSSTAAEPVLVPVGVPVFAYYFQGPGRIVANWDFRALRTAAEAREFLASHLDGAPSAWLVLSRIWRVDPDGWLPRVLAEDGRILSETRLPGVRILHWQRGGEVLQGGG